MLPPSKKISPSHPHPHPPGLSDAPYPKSCWSSPKATGMRGLPPSCRSLLCNFLAMKLNLESRDGKDVFVTCPASRPRGDFAAGEPVVRLSQPDRSIRTPWLKRHMHGTPPAAALCSSVPAELNMRLTWGTRNLRAPGRRSPSGTGRREASSSGTGTAKSSGGDSNAEDRCQNTGTA